MRLDRLSMVVHDLHMVDLALLDSWLFVAVFVVVFLVLFVVDCPRCGKKPWPTTWKTGQPRIL